MPSDAVGTLARSTHIEVIPMRGAVEKMLAAPEGTTFTLTCSPKLGLDRTVETAEKVAGLGYRIVPHLAARQVGSAATLREIVGRLGQAGVTDLFVIGGDAEGPAGPYSCAADLLEALAAIEHPITRIGVGCYPEGHPSIAEEVLDADLHRKQRHADYMVSQLCFDALALLRWLTQRRADGLTLPLRVGVAGPVQIRKLIELSMRIGVGSSVRYLTKQHSMVRNLVRGNAYRPEQLLSPLGDEAQCQALGIEGLHLFSFNQIDLAADWQRQVTTPSGQAGLA
ncbi:methylenetetrahydrofolate reductase [Amycolatopsis ultiminotia]|uniref:Methylenetetrahydrofolate reductase n=1 Tax=Amycolatopsis ultiminotia TaxID=543629 RepID=A0ABP6Y4H3_9PSEU